MTDSLNRNAVRFLVLAVAIAVFIGFPMEQVMIADDPPKSDATFV
jgi:hypothetical protein